MRAVHKAAIHSPEWHEKRRHGIGGSEWTALMAIVDEEKYKYGCQRRIWYDKRGIEPDFSVLVTAPMERGSALEPVVHDMFVYNNPDIRVLEYHEWPGDVEHILPGVKRPKWWIGNPDGIYEEDGSLGVEEDKTMNKDVFLDAAENGISDGYVMQPLHYMAMKGLRKGTIACLWPDGWGYFDMAAVWDSSTVEAMLHAGELFWSLMKSGKDIARPLPTELRCGKCPYRIKCLGHGYYETHVLKIQNLSNDDTLYAMMQQFNQLRAQETEAKRHKEELQRNILRRLGAEHGDPEHIICRGFELKSLQTTRTELDRNRIISHHPEIVHDVVHKIPTRGFNLKEKKTLLEAWDLKTL